MSILILNPQRTQEPKCPFVPPRCRKGKSKQAADRNWASITDGLVFSSTATGYSHSNTDQKKQKTELLWRRPLNKLHLIWSWIETWVLLPLCVSIMILQLHSQFSFVWEDESIFRHIWANCLKPLIGRFPSFDWKLRTGIGRRRALNICGALLMARYRRPVALKVQYTGLRALTQHQTIVHVKI